MNVTFKENAENSMGKRNESGNPNSDVIKEPTPTFYPSTRLFVDPEKQMHHLPPLNNGSTTVGEFV